MSPAMKHAGSTRSIAHHKAMKYKYYISLITMSLLITSLIVVFTAISLLKWYRIPYLKSWDSYFEIAPYLVLAVGSFTFLVSFFGFFVSPLGSRFCLILLALFLSIACIAQIGSVFITWKLSNTVKDEVSGTRKIAQDLNNYYISKSIKKEWDDLQSNFQCCGAEGYKDWLNLASNSHDVPDTCCTKSAFSVGCGKMASTQENPWQKYYIHGCMNMMIKWLENDVAQMIQIYAGLGAAIAVLEVIGISLASAYAAQINRKHLREKEHRLENIMYKQPRQGFNKISVNQIEENEISQDQDSEVEV